MAERILTPLGLPVTEALEPMSWDATRALPVAEAYELTSEGICAVESPFLEESEDPSENRLANIEVVPDESSPTDDRSGNARSWRGGRKLVSAFAALALGAGGVAACDTAGAQGVPPAACGADCHTLPPGAGARVKSSGEVGKVTYVIAESGTTAVQGLYFCVVLPATNLAIAAGQSLESLASDTGLSLTQNHGAAVRQLHAAGNHASAAAHDCRHLAVSINRRLGDGQVSPSSLPVIPGRGRFPVGRQPAIEYISDSEIKFQDGAVFDYDHTTRSWLLLGTREEFPVSKGGRITLHVGRKVCTATFGRDQSSTSLVCELSH